MKKPKISAKLVAISFFTVMVAGAAVALVLPLRPSYSETEKRELTKFPEFSAAALLDGSYFDSISTWYADTFPFRETLISFNSKIKSLYGVGDSISGFSDEILEEIPIVPEDEPQKPAEVPTKAEPETSEPETSEPETSEPETSEPETSESEITAPEDGGVYLVQELGDVLVVEDAGYEYYHFIRSFADDYAAAVSKVADALKGTARVFDMVVPTSMDITLPDSVRKDVNSSKQSDAINYIYSMVSPNAYKVKTYDALRAHKNEYVYFRTDHHWTALGAYYAYVEYTKLAGIKTAQLTDFEEVKFDNFFGSFYSDSGKNPALEKNPDTVYAYRPKGDIKFQYTDKHGTVNNWKVVTDVTAWAKSTKYNTFVAGDQPYAVIKNPAITDGSSCLIVKESFGNAFAPFLVENYATVHIIDYRLWKGSITDFVKKNSIDDVIYLNNVSATRNNGLIKMLNSVA